MQFFVLSTLLLGAVGFLAGFLGPILIQPEANQGPLLGILITGPLGVVLGAILGITLPRLASVQSRYQVLLGVACLVGLGIPLGLYAFQEPEFVGRLYSAEITAPRPAIEEISSAIDKWQTMAKRYPNASQTSWQADRKNRVLQAQGTIVTLAHSSVWNVYRQRRSWDRGKLTFQPQQINVPNQAYFASDIPIPASGWFLSKTSNVPDEWPPLDVATFLGFQELRPASSDIRPPSSETSK